MNPKRPLAVTILACVYLAVGAGGSIAHLADFRAGGFAFDNLLVELVCLAAVVAGAFLLRGQDWARWLALAWIAFHVVLSVFHPVRELAVHAVFCAIVAWVLLRREARSYFRPQA